MITCNSCNFLVNGNLKFSINANQCPSCGSALLSNETLKKVNYLTTELFHNGFDYSRSELKLLSIFFVNKIGKLEGFEGAEVEVQEQEVKTIDGDLSQIRDEVAAEFKDEIPLVEDEDEDKVQRLQRIAKENRLLNKRGAAVRRVSDD